MAAEDGAQENLGCQGEDRDSDEMLDGVESPRPLTAGEKRAARMKELMKRSPVKVIHNAC